MKKLQKIFSTFILVFILTLVCLPIPIHAEEPEMVLDGGYAAKIIGYKQNKPIYQVNFAAPTYCPDKETRISTQWYEQKDGTFISGDNLFSSNVADENIIVEHEDESMTWTPEIILVGYDAGKDYVLSSLNAKPEILKVDPMNENYKKNTLVWHYENGVDRYFRLIEGQCQEYFVVNQPLECDLVIDPNAKQTKNFKGYEKAIAYDEVGTGIPLTENENKVVTLKAEHADQIDLTKNINKKFINLYKEDIKEKQQESISKGETPEVQYPLVIDPNYTFVSSASDGFIGRSGSVYNTVWAATSASFGQSSVNTLMYVGQILDGSTYYIDRSALYFDTSVLSTSITITGVDLKIYGDSDYSATDFDITLQQGGTTYPHDPLVFNDFNKTNYTTTSVGVLSTIGFSTVAYNTLSFNAADFSMVSKTGVTKLFVRSSRDIAGTAPIGREDVSFYTYEKGTGYWPQLVVTFTAADPSITAVAASNIGTIGARLNSLITDDGGEKEGDTEVRFGYGTTELNNIGTCTNNTGTCNGSPVDLDGGFTEAVYRTTTITVTVAGTFDIALPAGITGVATSGTATLGGSPVALPAGATTTVNTGATVGNFTILINNIYDTVTVWDSGWGLGTPNAYLDITGLTPGTVYYFRVQIKNTTSTQSSVNELTFTTSANVNDVTLFNGIPDITFNSLITSMPSGALEIMIRYDTDTYPTTIADGFEVYTGTSVTVTHSSLTAGITYYYSAWGKSGVVYSTNAKNLALTTLGTSYTDITGGDDLPTPSFSASFFQPVLPSNLSRFEPFYSIVNGFAASWGMDTETMWAILVLVIIAFIAFIVLIESQNFFATAIVSSIIMMGAVFMSLLPGYFLAVAIIMDMGAWRIEHSTG